MKVCKRCLMDDTAKDIAYDNEGICNFCTQYKNKISSIVFENEQIRSRKRDSLLQIIKLEGADKKYDCIVGLSGGVDSSYVLHLAVEAGLRPLVVHMDNNWNSELAVSNIKNLVSKLNVFEIAGV